MAAELTQNVYITPEAQNKGTLQKSKSLYWDNREKDTTQLPGAKVSQVNPAVLYWLDDSCSVMGVRACHVDDLIWGG